MLRFEATCRSIVASLAALFFVVLPLRAEDAMIRADAVAGMELVSIDTEDFYRYRAVLVDAEEGADLYIFTEDGFEWKQAVHAPEIVWRGGIGQEPWLEALEGGSIRLYSENISIGRDRWEQILTIAYRGGEFLVAGYTFTYYDTLDPDAAGKCDVNLLTGKGVHNDKTFRTKLPATKVSAWTQETRPPECERR